MRYNQDQTFRKIPFVIYVDKESLLEKIQTCDNRPEEWFTSRTTHYTVCSYSLTQFLFDATKIRQDFYRHVNSMTKFCRDLREQATKLIHSEKL